MAPQPGRLPGDSNPEPNQDQVDHVARSGLMANGHGIGDFGIVRGILALLDRRKRGKRGRRDSGPGNTLLGQ